MSALAAVYAVQIPYEFHLNETGQGTVLTSLDDGAALGHTSITLTSDFLVKSDQLRGCLLLFLLLGSAISCRLHRDGSLEENTKSACVGDLLLQSNVSFPFPNLGMTGKNHFERHIMKVCHSRFARRSGLQRIRLLIRRRPYGPAIAPDQHLVSGLQLLGHDASRGLFYHVVLIGTAHSCSRSKVHTCRKIG